MNLSSGPFNVRKPCLPPGWYPREPEKIRGFLEGFASPGDAKTGPVIAAAAPHAGWYYSGAIAAKAVAALAAGSPGGPVTVALIGGHLPGGAPPLFAPEDAAATPLGTMEIDGELREALSGLRAVPDRYRDNTVEVLLPMAGYFFPGARLLWMRLPADLSAFDAGKALARAAASLGRKLFVLGSTDLSHYGPDYGFIPKGQGLRALEWVKTVNDRRFIDAVRAGDPALVLERAEGERAACSAGAVLGVMGYAAEIRPARGAGGECIAYGTSADIGLEETGELPGSFVGYGAFVWR
ncbi:MAG: AmmeMemoRadiSam system protein B [Treponema sp.]|jgi:AmmeMemoRadiSam system protein B|nr:AmmeMemoRadiSam system protein B [Treponema sp.]